MTRVRGQAYEFVGGAIVPIGTGSAVANEMINSGKDIAPGFVEPRVEVAAGHLVAQIKGSPTRIQYATEEPVFVPPSKPINVLREAKLRLREVRRQLKSMRALEREASELERIIKAATAKPSPVVRSLSRTTG